MKRILIFLSACTALLHAAEERPSPPYAQLVEKRLHEGIDGIAKSDAMTSKKPGAEAVFNLAVKDNPWRRLLFSLKRGDIQ